MKNLIGKYYVEVKDKRFSIHPNEKIELRLGEETKSVGTQNQFQNDTHIRKIYKVSKKMMKLSLRINLKGNNHLFNNLKIIYLIVLVAKKKYGQNSIMDLNAKLLSMYLLLLNRSINSMKRLLDKLGSFQLD